MTSRSWTLAFAGHPPGPNDRMGWAKRARLTKAWRTEAALAAKAAGIPTLARARLSLVVVRARLGTADPDNDVARAKPLIDGIRDADVLVTDLYRCVEIGTAREERGAAGVRLVIEEVLR